MLSGTVITNTGTDRHVIRRTWVTLVAIWEVSPGPPGDIKKCWTRAKNGSRL